MRAYEQTYQILSTLGRGGMGSVYLVRHMRLGTLWAMKEVVKTHDHGVDLLGEANMLKRLNHPALPRIIDIYDEPNSLYIVEDYIEGISLDKRLLEVYCFPEQQVRGWMEQLLDVLQYLHEQRPHPIIYRDMKPANIMLTPDGSIKLIDFGIAREYKIGSGGDTSYLGTRGYAAPEQFGVSQTDARTDIYSLGVTIYHLLTGKGPNDPPYVLRPIREWNKSLSEGMEYIIEKCTQGDPLLRYQSAAELRKDLQNIDRFSAASKRQARTAAAQIVACCLIIALGTGIMLYGRQMAQTEFANQYEEQYAAGTALLQTGDWEQAKEILERADALSETSDGRLAVLTALINADAVDDCAAYAEQAAAEEPSLLDNAEFNFIWGIALDGQSHSALALEKFETAYRIAPDNVMYLRYLARAYAVAGDVDTANELCVQLQRISDDASIYFVQAGILAASKDYDGAVDAYQQCIAQCTDPTVCVTAYRELAKLYKAQRTASNRMVDLEIETLHNMQVAYPNEEQAFVWESLAEAYYTRGVQNGSQSDLGNAASCFQNLITLGYGRAGAYISLSIVQIQLGAYADAEATLIKLTDRYPKNPDAYVQRAFLLVEQEDKKAQSSRNYTPILEYYEKAKELGASGANMQRLEGMITDLRSGGWL